MLAKRKYEIKKWEWFFLFISTFLCFLLFSHEDIITTGDNSLTFFFFSNPLKFYSNNFYWYNGYAANYMPTIYILFAFWNAPLVAFSKIIEIFFGHGLLSNAWGGNSIFVVYYYKIFPILLYFISSILIYKLCINRLSFSNENAILCSFLFLSSPFSFFSQFIFCQYDIIVVFFMLLGLQFAFKEDITRRDWVLFDLFFGIAFTCKYFVLIPWLVILFVREKNVFRICQNALFFIAIFVAEFLVAISCDFENFVANVFNFPAIDFATHGLYIESMLHIKILPLFLMIMVVGAFFSNPTSFNDCIKECLFYCCGACFCFFSLMTFYPQWIMFGTIFWTLSFFYCDNSDRFLWLELLAFISFVMFVVYFFKGSVDESLLKKGILNGVLGKKDASNVTMSSLFGFLSKKTFVDLFYTFFVGFQFVSFYYRNPQKNICEKPSFSFETGFHFFIFFRIAIVILIFVIPACLCIPSYLKSPDLLWKRMCYNYTNQKTGKFYREQIPVNSLAEGERHISQVATLKGFAIKKVETVVSVQGVFSSESTIVLDVYDMQKEKIGTSFFKLSDQFDINEELFPLCLNEAILEFVFENEIYVKNGEQYFFDFRVENGTDSSEIFLFKDFSEVKWDPDTFLFDYSNDYAIIDGENVKYNLCLMIKGKGCK